jgi:hypothetical protein
LARGGGAADAIQRRTHIRNQLLESNGQLSVGRSCRGPPWNHA